MKRRRKQQPLPELTDEEKKHFESSLIDDIHDVEQDTWRKAEEKKEELRSLVGVRYRDLLQSADAIITMKQLCGDSLQIWSELMDRLRQLSDDDAKSEATALNEKEMSNHQLLQQLNVVFHCHEMIWAHVEEGSFSSAVQLFYGAKSILAQLMKQDVQSIALFARAEAASFHHLRTHIPRKCYQYLLRPNMWSRFYAEALASLGAFAAIDRQPVCYGVLVDGSQASLLGLFLSTQYQRVETILKSGLAVVSRHGRHRRRKSDQSTLSKAKRRNSAHARQTTAVDLVAKVLCQMARAVLYTVLQAVQLFPPDLSKTSLASSSAEIALGPILDGTSTVSALLQKIFAQVFSANMEPSADKASLLGLATTRIPLSGFREQLNQWLEKCQGLRPSISELFGFVVSCQDLGHVQELLVHDIGVLVAESITSNSFQKSKHVDDAPSEVSSDMTRDSVRERGILLTWHYATTISFQHKVEVWETLFASAFWERAAALVRSQFDDVPPLLASTMDSVLESIALREQSKASNADGKTEDAPQEEPSSEHSLTVDGFGNVTLQAAVPGSTVIAHDEPDVDDESFLDTQVIEFCQRLTKRLSVILRDVRHLMRYPSINRIADASSIPSMDLSGDGSSQTDRGRTRLLSMVVKHTGIAEIRAHIVDSFLPLCQKSCMNSITTACRHLQSKLTDIQARIFDMLNASDASVFVEQSVFVARVASTLVKQADELQLQYSQLGRVSHSHRSAGTLYDILSMKLVENDSDGLVAMYQRSGDSKSSAADADPSRRAYEFTLQTFQSVAHFGFRIWTRSVASSLGDKLREDFKSWLKLWSASEGNPIVYQWKGVRADGQDDMSLPVHPSQYVFDLLYTLNAEMYRVTSSQVELYIIRSVVVDLAESALGIFESVLLDGAAEDGTSTTPARTVQELSDAAKTMLLFDLSFLFHMLNVDALAAPELHRLVSKHSSQSAGTSLSSNPAEELRARKDSVIAAVSSCIDPVDWITMKPHLLSRVLESTLHCGVMFGSFVRLERLHRSLTKKEGLESSGGKATESSNIVQFREKLPPIPYCPVFYPQLSARQTVGSPAHTPKKEAAQPKTQRMFSFSRR